jgi:hypothetical protein
VALAPAGQLLLQHQGEERAEHMAADRGICGIIDRSGPEDRLGGETGPRLAADRASAARLAMA